jgi:hypothetical protein
MARSLTRDEVLRLRLRSQQLTGPQAAEVAQVVRRMGAIQAQSTRDARLAVRPAASASTRRRSPRPAT